MAAAVVGRLGVPSFGMGGHALQDAHLETIVDARRVAVMGVAPVVGRIGDVVGAALRLVAAARRRRPRAALLVGYSEFNAHLGRALRGFGTRVLWYSPPQVWAWRRQRAAALTKSCDAMAVILPFEADLWQRSGIRAEFVGHPAVETVRHVVDAPSPAHFRLLLLPGSRSQEVKRHWPLMIDTVTRLARRGSAGVVVATSLPPDERAALERTAAAHDIRVHEGPVATALGDYDIALAASGTVTVECVAAGVPPVIIYRTDDLTYRLARRVVRVTSIGLPNLVAGERIFPEFVQHDAEPARIAGALLSVWRDRDRYRRACSDVRYQLHGTGPLPSVRVAQMLADWL